MRSFVQVRTLCPSPIDSHPFRKDICYAVVIDATHGYVLVSRKYVPHYLCDIFIVLLNQLKSLEKLCFTPHLNYAIVKYDPGLVLADVKTPVLELHHYKEEISRF